MAVFFLYKFLFLITKTINELAVLYFFKIFCYNIKDINNNIVTCEILEKNLVKTNMYITNKKLYAYVNVLDDEDKAINNILYDINKTKYLHSDIMDEELIIK
jgi:hypothetical protein